MPLSSAMSVPGRIGRCRSAKSAVSVRRGSTAMIMTLSGSAIFLRLMRLKNYRMTVGRVGTDEEKAFRNVDIRVASRRAVRAEGRLITRRRRCHAQTGVGIEVI